MNKDFISRLVSVVPNRQQVEWQKMEYTAFFHFGTNTFTGREWGDGTASPDLFSPHSLDTDQWCRILKEGGIRGCILTAKHHDGFCLWDTKLTDYNVMNSPLKRDVMAELAASCRKYGIRLGAYLSPWDRNHPAYGQGKAYDDYYCGQLEELLTNYGELYTMWFDGACGEGPNGKKQSYDWDRYYATVRRLQPNALMSVCGPDIRWCGNEAGDCRPSEWSVVPARLRLPSGVAERSQSSDDDAFRQKTLTTEDQDLGSRKVLQDEPELIWYPSEVDTSIRPGWFYHEEEDNQVLSFQALKTIYLGAAGGNAVLLLNLPPNKEGRIPSPDEGLITSFGRYLRETFSHNLAQDAQVAASCWQAPHQPRNILTEDEQFWKGEDWCGPCSLELTLPEERDFDYLVLQEQITCSQRIEEFTVEAYCGGGWHTLYSGTTVGYKKICPVTGSRAEKLRVSFLQHRVCPTIKFLGLYKEGAGQ